MTNIQKLQELREKAYELAKTNPSKIAIEFKQSFYEDMQKLKASEEYQDMGTGGRVKMEDKLRATYNKRLFKVIAEQKAEYAKVHAEATTLAKTVQVTDHAKPADALAVKLFEQELDSLKTATMLGIDVDRSIDAVDAFIDKYGDEPYFAAILKQNFGQLSQNVLSIASTPQNRQALSKVLERVESKATTEEQAFAADTLTFFGDGEPTFFLPGLAQHSAISTIIGAHNAAYLEKPHEWLEVQEQAAQAE